MADDDGVLQRGHINETRLNDLQDQLDRRIETQHRELDAATEALALNLKALDRLVTNEIEALDERMKVIFEENRRASVIAEQEREKAAVQIRASMERAMEEGDENLRRHITEQIASIQAALRAQEQLGNEKDKRMEVIHQMSEEAVRTALVAQKEQAEKHNDLIRASERKEAFFASATELRELRERVDRAVPREVIDSELKARDTRLDLMKEEQDKKAGSEQFGRRQEDRRGVTVGNVIAAAVAIIALIAIIATVILANANQGGVIGF